jgi:regulator of sigma E protease
MIFNAFFCFFHAKLLPLLAALIGIGLLIAIHECGHFIFCKIFGIHTPTFSIGFGPEIFRKKIGNTDFRLAAIPLGGYVEIAGLAEVGQGDQAHANAAGPDSFESKPYWQKLFTMVGGILFNFLFAIIVLSALFMIGSSEPQAVIVGGLVKDSAAVHGGLKAGDAIVEINGQSLVGVDGRVLSNARETLLTVIRGNPGKAVNLSVQRNKEKLPLTLTLGSRIETGKEIGVLGAELRTPMPQLPFFKAIGAGFTETFRLAGMIVYGIKYLITQRTLEGTGGPLMIMSMISDAAHYGFGALLMFLAFISVNLAVLNLFPIAVLDGGQILFITIEAILGRKMPLPLRNGINIVSWLFLLGLLVFLTYRDMVTLFGGKLAALYQKIVGWVR